MVLENNKPDKTIIRNQQAGKGMMMSLKIITDEEGEHMHMFNSYFSGSVYQNYSQKKNTTSINGETRMMYSPKWLTAKLGGIGSNEPTQLIIKDKHHRISFTGYSGQLNSIAEKQGIAFQGNIDNINQLKELKQKLNHARDIVKHNSYDDILSCVKHSTLKSMASALGLFGTTTNEHYLDSDKFFKLNGTKN